MLELAICCINIIRGNTSDTPASAGAPRRPTKCASILAVTAIRMTLTTRLGRASVGCAVCEMADAMGVSHLDQDRTTLVGMRRLTGWLSGNPETKSQT